MSISDSSTKLYESDFAHLKELESRLKGAKAAGKSVYLKIEGSEINQRIVVVQDSIWNSLIARVACFFNVHSYDLQAISSVFEEQLKLLKETYTSTKKDYLRTTGAALADIFIKEMTPSSPKHCIANPQLKEESQQEIKKKISNIKKSFFTGSDIPVSMPNKPIKQMSSDIDTAPLDWLFEQKEVTPSKPSTSLQAQELQLQEQSTPAARSPQEVLHETLKIESIPGEINANTLSDFVNSDQFQERARWFRSQIDQLVRDKPLEGIAFKAGPENQGSLAAGVFSTITTHLQHAFKEMQDPNLLPQKRIAAFHQYTHYLVEATTLFGAFGKTSLTPLQRLQCQRALLLMELRSLLLKAEVIVIPTKQSEQQDPATLALLANVTQQLPKLWDLMAHGAPYTSEKKGFSQKRLEQVTDEELKEIRIQIEQSLSPLQPIWQEEIKFQGSSVTAAHSFAKLVLELDTHFQAIKEAKKSITTDYNLDCLKRPEQGNKSRYITSDSLAAALYDRIRKTFDKYTTDENAVFEQVIPALQEADYLLQARGVPSQDEETIQKAKRAVLYLELQAFLDKADEALKTSIGDVSKTLAYLKKELSKHSPDQISVDELDGLRRQLFNTIESLATKDKVRVPNIWPHCGTLRREFENHLRELSQ